MKNYEDNAKKYSKRNHLKNKSEKTYKDDDIKLNEKAKKQFKLRKQNLQEEEDDWENWEEYL
jgi:hypothetical protein